MWRQAAGCGWSEFGVCSPLFSCYHAQADQHQVQYSTSRYSTPTEQHQVQYSNSCQYAERLLAVDGQSLECVPHSSAVTMLKQTSTRYSTAPTGAVHHHNSTRYSKAIAVRIHKVCWLWMIRV
jgi:hypothetical protein